MCLTDKLFEGRNIYILFRIFVESICINDVIDFSLQNLHEIFLQITLVLSKI